MAHKSNENNNKTIEIKQNFLASAITDISTYIQLADTKVSIIMGAVVAILVGIAACYEPIERLINNITPSSWKGVLLIILITIGFISMILIFVFGLMTVRGHSSIINYKSKWYLTKSTKEYSFTEFSSDIKNMDDNDIITNMAAELYKLNDIKRQKLKTVKWTLLAFSVFLIVVGSVCTLLLVSIM